VNDLYETTEGFELITSGAEHAYLYVRAAQEIGACLSGKNIPTSELEALIARCETILRERRALQPADYYKQKVADLVCDLTGEKHD
jgi:hypothetical protein